jgi:MFS superfamily sulfate permease-like transporter
VRCCPFVSRTRLAFQKNELNEYPHRTYDADRKLLGQGLASVTSGFCGGILVTGATARTLVHTAPEAGPGSPP